MEGLDWQAIQIPFGTGLDQGTDEHALTPTELVRALDVEFDKRGALNTRKPYSLKGLAVAPGSTAIALEDVRRIVTNGEELLLLTKERLYSLDDQLSVWVERDWHLAVALDEYPRFATTGDQRSADRAELNGHVFITWYESLNSQQSVFVAAYNASTGAVTMTPREIVNSGSPRLTALDTRIVLSFSNGNGYECYLLDPAAPLTALAGATTQLWVQPGGVGYDVMKVPGADQAMFAMCSTGGTSYRVATLTAGGALVTSAKARAAGVISLAISPNNFVQIVRRQTTTTVVGDLLNLATLADVFTGTAIGTTTVTVTQIASCFRSVTTGGFYRCYCFWNDQALDSGPNVVRNWVDTSNNSGAASEFFASLDINSRAFERGGAVFVWLGFSQASTFVGGDSEMYSFALQNSYFLYRDDKLLCGKAATSRAGGASATVGHLPNVQALGNDKFAWCGLDKRVIELGGAGKRRTNYAAREPREVMFSFDDDRARRCVRLGGTLYITGAEVKQYDGVRLTEVGFHIQPYLLLTSLLTGTLALGDYAVKYTPRWQNAAGEVERGTTAATVVQTVNVASRGIHSRGNYLYVTHKPLITLEGWRTEANPTADSDFFLTTDKDPAVVTSPNQYIENNQFSASTVAGRFWTIDNVPDTDLTSREASPENGTTLENLAPPAANIIAANADRIFLAGIAGDPDRVWYSKQRGDGQVAAFNEVLTASVPAQGGAITALAFLGETLFVFRERCIYALPGDGLDNNGAGQNFGPARAVALDVGATNAAAVAVEPRGIIFKSSKGWRLLDRGWSVRDIGEQVRAYDQEDVVAVHVVDTVNQIRCLTRSRMLLLDYSAATEESPAGAWSEWSLANGLGAAMWGDSHLYLATDGLRIQEDDFAGVTYGMDVELLVKMNDLQGVARCRRILLLAEYRGDCDVRVRIARDYESSYFHDVVWTPSPAVVGGTLQLKIGPKFQRCAAYKIRITAVKKTGSVIGVPSTEALKLVGIGLEVGFKRGLNRRIPRAQKV